MISDCGFAEDAPPHAGRQGRGAVRHSEEEKRGDLPPEVKTDV